MLTEKRKNLRIRLSLEEKIKLRVFLYNFKKFFDLQDVADVSSDGIAFFDLSKEVQYLDLSDLQQIEVYYGDKLIATKHIQAFNKNTITLRGVSNVARIGLIFGEEKLPINLANDYVIDDKLGMKRIKDKKFLRNIVQSIISGESDLKTKIIQNKKELIKNYRFRYNIYLETDKIKEQYYPKKMFTDFFDNHSLHLATNLGDFTVASARITFRHNIDHFEMEQYYNLVEHFKYKTAKTVEVSRFCVDHFYRKNVNKNLKISLYLYLEVYKTCLINDITTLLIVSTESYLPLYNMLGFKQITPYFMYEILNTPHTIMVLDLPTLHETMSPEIYPLFEKVKNKVKKYNVKPKDYLY